MDQDLNNKSTKKRQRTENWLMEDMILLKELVKERVQTIESKATDSNNNKRKATAWLDLQHNFNSMCTGAHRAVSQLKSKWTAIKIIAKKQKSLSRQTQMKTVCRPQSMTAEDICSWLPYEFVVDVNSFISFGLNQSQDTSDQPVYPAGETSSDDHSQMDLTRSDMSPETGPSEVPVFINATAEVLPCLTKRQISGELSQSTSSSDIPLAGFTSQVSVAQPLRPTPATAAEETLCNNVQPRIIMKKKHKNVLKKKSRGKSEARRALLLIARNELRCRNELHQSQMETEALKQMSLKLKCELMKEKVLFYRRQNEES